MRVCLLTTKLAGVVGGAERVLLDLAEELEVRGHEVSTVTFDGGATGLGFDSKVVPIDVSPFIHRALRRPKVAVTRFRAVVSRRSMNVTELTEWWPAAGQLESPLQAPRGVPTRLNSLAWTFRVGLRVAKLRRWLEANPQDVVIAFLPFAVGLAGEALNGMSNDRPAMIASLHSHPNIDFSDDGPVDRNPRVRATAYGGLVQADLIAVLVQGFIDLLPDELVANAVVVPNPMQPRVFPNSKREDVIVGVGRLVKIKRYDLLLRAFASIADEFPTWRVEICGDGTERPNLEALIQELHLDQRVTLHGMLEDLDSAYEHAKVFAHPSLFEGMSLVLLDAVANGVPVVAFRSVLCTTEIVDDGLTGRLVDTVAPDSDGTAEFAAALRELINDPPTRSEMEAGAKRVAERYGASLVYDRWEAAIATACARRSGHVRTFIRPNELE